MEEWFGSGRASLCDWCACACAVRICCVSVSKLMAARPRAACSGGRQCLCLPPCAHAGACALERLLPIAVPAGGPTRDREPGARAQEWGSRLTVAWRVPGYWAQVPESEHCTARGWALPCYPVTWRMSQPCQSQMRRGLQPQARPRDTNSQRATVRGGSIHATGRRQTVGVRLCARTAPLGVMSLTTLWGR